MRKKKAGVKESATGNVLLRLRRMSGLTTIEVAAATGIAVTYISYLETQGTKNPSARVMYQFSIVYGVDLTWLVLEYGIDKVKAAVRPNR